MMTSLPTIIIDGNNVIFHNSSKGKFQNIQTMVNFIKQIKKNPLVFVSARLRHVIDKPEEYKRFINQECVREIPANTDGDLFILEASKKLKVPIISNDLFRQYYKRYPQVNSKRIPFMIVLGKVIIPKFNLN